MFYWARVITAGLLLTFASSWCFVKVLKAEPGRQRLLQAIPAFLIYILVPFLFCHETEMLSLAGVAYLSFRLPAIKVSLVLPFQTVSSMSKQVRTWYVSHAHKFPPAISARFGDHCLHLIRGWRGALITAAKD